MHWREGSQAGLGAGQEDLLRLTEVRGARRARGPTGLYHFALLYPSRHDLARAIARLFALRYPNAPTDHVISKTTYLDDPEGQNIELYIRSLEDGVFRVTNGRLDVRHADGRPSDGREPLDLEALFAELGEDDRLDEPAPAGLTLGHVHLYGADLNASMHFYRDVLGFGNETLLPDWRMGDVSPNELPHMIAFNTWAGEGAPPPPPGALGMRYFTIVLPNEAELERVLERVHQAGLTTESTPEGRLVRDPSHLGIVLTDNPRARGKT